MIRTRTAVKGGEDDISSPNDWPNTFPQLKDVDNLLRCGICYDFLKTAMGIKSCSHTFCSLCIRQYFSYQNKCPTCYTNAVESDLQNNRLLDEIIQKFIDVRSVLIQRLQNGKETQNISSKQESHGSGSEVTQLDTGKRISLRNKSKEEKQKTEESKHNSSSADLTSDNDQNQSIRGKIETPGRRSTRGSQRVSLSLSKTHGKAVNGKKKEVELTPVKDKKDKDNVEEDSVLISSDDSDSEEDVLRTVPSHPRVDSLSMLKNISEREKCGTSPIHVDEIPGTVKSVIIPSDTDSIASLHDQSDVSSNASIVIQPKGDNNTAPCPVCGVEIRTQVINLHLDSCLAGTEKKSALRRSVLLKRKPLPKLVYNLLSEKELRKKLKEIGLSVKGDKKVLIKRHHDYVLRYNADCDSLHPKSGEEIIKEVEKNERAKTTNMPFVSKKLVVDKGSSPRTVRKAQEKYEKAHEKQFTDLIKATRQRMKSNTTNMKRQTRSSVTEKADTVTSISPGNLSPPSEKTGIDSRKCEQSGTEYSDLDLITSEPELSDSNDSKPKTRKSLRLSKSIVSDTVDITDSKSKLTEERKSSQQNDGEKLRKNINLNEENSRNSEKEDTNIDEEKLDCSKCIDKKQPVSPCQIHKNKVHIQVEVHNSPKCTRHLLFNEEGNELEDDLKSSNDSDSIRASRRTRSNISKTESDATNSSNKKSHLNVSISTERKKKDKAETHGELKTVKRSQNKSKHATRNTENVEESPNKNSPRKPKSDLTKSNDEKETEVTLVQNSLGQDINKHSNKKSSRKSASDLTNIMNGKETGCTLATDKTSPRKSVDLTDMNEEMDIQFISEEKFSKKEMEAEHVVRHLCNSDKILRDSPFKSPFKDKYMFSFSPKTDKCHSNISESTNVSESLFKDIHQHNECSEEFTKKSPKLNVPSPKTDSPIKSSFKRNMMSPRTTSPRKISSKASILSPGTKSPVKSPSRGNIFSPRSTSPAHNLSPGVNSPSKKPYKSHGTNSPSKPSFKANFLSPETNSPSKSLAKTHKILSPGTRSPHKILSPGTKSPHKILSPGTRSPHKILSSGTKSPHKILSPGTKSPHKILSSGTKSPHKILSPGTKSPHKILSPRTKSPHKILSPGTKSPHKILSSGTKSPHKILSPRTKSPYKIASSRTKSPHKILSPGIKSPHKIMSPRRAGLSCSPLRQHKLVKTGDITWNIVDDSESETDLNDSLINKIAKSIDKFESEEDDVLFSDFKKTWPVLSSQNSTRDEECDKVDDSTLESDTESNASFESDISNVVPETAPIKLQKNDYFVSRRSHSRSKCKEDKCAKLRNKRKYSTAGGNQESKRRRIN